MKETIYTIPISEVFEPRCGCPLCALHAALEARWVEYITGAAMMEPDVRMETNAQGFCARHFGALLEQRNRLAVALLLQTRLEHIDKHLADTAAPGLLGRKPKQVESTCFVCGRVERELQRMVDNLVVVWARDSDFRALYAQQEYVCFPHYQLLAGGGHALRGKDFAAFSAVTVELTRKALAPLKADIDAFCKLFDYRSAAAEQPSAQVSSSLERAIAYLTSTLRADK